MLRSLINVCVVPWRLPNIRCYIFVKCRYAICPNVRVWVSRKRKVLSWCHLQFLIQIYIDVFWTLLLPASWRTVIPSFVGQLWSIENTLSKDLMWDKDLLNDKSIEIQSVRRKLTNGRAIEVHNLLHSREFADLLIFSSHKLRTRWFVCPVLGRLLFGTNEKR